MASNAKCMYLVDHQMYKNILELSSQNLSKKFSDNHDQSGLFQPVNNSIINKVSPNIHQHFNNNSSSRENGGSVEATSPRGFPGATGTVGPPGATGAVGPAGPRGPPGTPGSSNQPGPARPRGLPGPPGPSSQPGASGPPGPQGLRGPAGQPGITLPIFSKSSEKKENNIKTDPLPLKHVKPADLLNDLQETQKSLKTYDLKSNPLPMDYDDHTPPLPINYNMSPPPPLSLPPPSLSPPPLPLKYDEPNAKELTNFFKNQKKNPWWRKRKNVLLNKKKRKIIKTKSFPNLEDQQNNDYQSLPQKLLSIDHHPSLPQNQLSIDHHPSPNLQPIEYHPPPSSIKLNLKNSVKSIENQPELNKYSKWETVLTPNKKKHLAIEYKPENSIHQTINPEPSTSKKRKRKNSNEKELPNKKRKTKHVEGTKNSYLSNKNFKTRKKQNNIEIFKNPKTRKRQNKEDIFDDEVKKRKLDYDSWM